MDATVHIFTATALERGRVASPTLGRLYPGKSPRCSFYRSLSEPQAQSGYEGAKKNLHHSNARERSSYKERLITVSIVHRTRVTY